MPKDTKHPKYKAQNRYKFLIVWKTVSMKVMKQLLIFNRVRSYNNLIIRSSTCHRQLQEETKNGIRDRARSGVLEN